MSVLDLLHKITFQEYFPNRQAKNEAAGTDFEKFVLSFFKKETEYPVLDFERLPIGLRTKIDEFLVSDDEENLRVEYSNCIILHPRGETKAPDLVIIENGKVYPIECKSSKNGIPDFGDNPPKPAYEYLFANTKRDCIIRISGKNIEHPVRHDPVYQEILSRLWVIEQEMKDHLASKYYEFAGMLLKYRLNMRLGHKISAEIK